MRNQSLIGNGWRFIQRFLKSALEGNGKIIDSEQEVGGYPQRAAGGDGSAPVTSESFQTQAAADLMTLSTNLAEMEAEQHAAVSNLFLESTSMPQTWTDTDGIFYFFDHEFENGSAGIKVTYNLESAQTISAQKLWPGGSSGFSLTGTNVLLAQWDGGDVLNQSSRIYKWISGQLA